MAGEHPMALPVELAAALQRVENDREHGASWLAREVARALAEASQPEKARDPTKQLAQLRAAAAVFATVRPSMAAVANSAARIWAAACASGAAPDARLRAAHEAAQELLRIWDDAPARIAAATSSLLAGTLFTHSRSGTVEAMLHTLVAERKPTAREVLVTESRPGGEGVVLARALTQAGWHVTLLADAAAGHFMRQAEAVVLGADSVRDDGSLVNKVGSYLVALAARDAQVPVYVLCETLKIAAPSFPLVFEEMKPDELLPHAPPGITPRNIYFDLTPARLISFVITEQGILSPADIHRLSAEAGAALSLLTT